MTQGGSGNFGGAGSGGGPPFRGPGGPGQPGPQQAPGYGPASPQGHYPHPYQHPAPGYVGPGAPQGFTPPPKRSKGMLYAGLGCLVFLLLAGGGAVAFFFWGYKKAQSAFDRFSTEVVQAQKDAEHAASALQQFGAPGGLACEQAAACCRKVMLKMNNQAEYQRCDAFLSAATVACQLQLAAFSVAAQNLGLACEVAPSEPGAATPAASGAPTPPPAPAPTAPTQ
jgi:hypothetical protein